MDISTIIGIVASVGALLAGFLLEKGSLASLGQLSALLIVFGGTAGAVISSYPLKELRKISAWFRIAFTVQPFDLPNDCEHLTQFAEKARREGLLSLEQELADIDDSFIRQGMQLVIDGTDPETTKQILEADIDLKATRHHVGISVFEAAGGFAPTLGIIGTVMGLIQVLGNLSDPSALSSSIASAFTATLYGVASANLLWLPIANKLKFKDKQENARMEMILEGILSIQAGENPSILKEKLKVHLSNTLNKGQKSAETFATNSAGYTGAKG